MVEKYMWRNGVKFTRDDKAGYYLNSTMRKRLHRYIWELSNGEIPKGYEIHHIDGDKANNDITNLAMLETSEHRLAHIETTRLTGNNNVESGHLERIRPLTKEWHASSEGREWHKEHYECNKDKLHRKDSFTCEQCGIAFESEVTGNNRFCSNKCKSAWRRASGIDDEERKCEICGKTFKTNKYSRTRTCSRKCGAILRKQSKSI